MYAYITNNISTCTFIFFSSFQYIKHHAIWQENKLIFPIDQPGNFDIIDIEEHRLFLLQTRRLSKKLHQWAGESIKTLSNTFKSSYYWVLYFGLSNHNEPYI